MPPVGINAPMATLPDYGTSSTYTSSTNTEGMTTVADTGAGVPSEMDGQYAAGTTDETVVMRIDSIVQERLARKAMEQGIRFATLRHPHEGGDRIFLSSLHPLSSLRRQGSIFEF